MCNTSTQLNSRQTVPPGYLHSVGAVSKGENICANTRNLRFAAMRTKGRGVDPNERVDRVRETTGVGVRRDGCRGRRGTGPPPHPHPPARRARTPWRGGGRSAIEETDPARTWLRRIDPKCGIVMNCWCQSVAHFHLTTTLQKSRDRQ